MAEVLVNALLLKLCDESPLEALRLYRVKDKVELVKSQLAQISSSLKDADSRRKENEGVNTWVKKVRDVSFQIEDAIDTFLYKVEKLSEKEHASRKRFVNLVIKGPMKLVAMHKLDSAIDKIQAKLKKISESRQSLGITDMGNMVATGSRNKLIPMYPDGDEIDLVGFDKEKKYIMELLLEQNTLRRSVVSIVGIGGLGKTALARKVYQSVRDEFDFHIWLTVSKDFKQIDLLKMILEKAEIEEANEERHIMVNKFLIGKKYFIVLDDIHSTDVWNQLMTALPDNGNRSRVLITTRNAEIAHAADETSVCELSFLPPEESIKLLFKKALPEENFNEGSYPPDLLEIARNLSNQCGGLPLALVVVGGLLSRKPQTHGAWQMVMQTMNWRSVASLTEIIASSYENLPDYLKSCFMYFASFPADHEYKAEFLTWIWIAERFIPHDEPGAMEKIAKKYLDELAQRCVIQVSKRSPDGSILIFRVHDLLHELAIYEAEEKDFIKVLSKKVGFRDNNRSVRHITSQLNDSTLDGNFSQVNKLTQNINPNVRTLLLFGKMVPFGSQFKLLGVLVIFHYNGTHHGDPFPGLLIGTLKKLLQLRYLALIGCSFPLDVVLPIDHLHKLITLVMRSCQNISLPPRSLWGITTLTHVLVDRAYNFSDTLEGMSKLVDVPNLQTLEEVKINKPGIELLNMLSLLKLHLINEHDSWKPIVTLLHKLQKLKSLTLQSMEIPLEIIDSRRFPCYQYLHILCLSGRWHLEDVEFSAEMIPPNLTMLTLASSHLDQKSMQVLEKLTCLRILALEMAYAENTMICSNNGFPQLQHLTLSMLKIYKLEIKEEAMPNLNYLELHSCEKMQFVPNLQHMKTLEVLSLRNMPERFKSMVENGDNMHKIKNIRSINFYE